MPLCTFLLVPSEEFFVVFDGERIRISTNAAKTIISIFRGEADCSKLKASLCWVFLHEISHLSLGHFEFSNFFGAARRGLHKANYEFKLPENFRFLVRLSLELQADHEAVSVLLGTYSHCGWSGLCQRISAISSMIVLIEREEAKLEHDERTHPKAATRIFQLLCHVAEMPLISAHLQKDASLLPTANEIERFGKEVTLPCYFDAMHLAELAGAESIKADLGNPEDFFADMATVKLGDLSRYADLKTEGAKEWAQLWECNEAVKPLQKSVHFAN